MNCRLCGSENEAELTSELMIHFSGRRHLENPGILSFPKLSVYLDCGSARFTIGETELTLLRAGITPSTTAQHKTPHPGNAG